MTVRYAGDRTLAEGMGNPHRPPPITARHFSDDTRKPARRPRRLRRQKGNGDEPLRGGQGPREGRACQGAPRQPGRHGVRGGLHGVRTHVHDLRDKLDDIQLSHTDVVVSSTHIHASEHYCLETIILKGKSKLVRDIADAPLGTMGVLNGDLVVAMIPESEQRPPFPFRNSAKEKAPSALHESESSPRPAASKDIFCRLRSPNRVLPI